jgi:hypothetical protein
VKNYGRKESKKPLEKTSSKGMCEGLASPLIYYLYNYIEKQIKSQVGLFMMTRMILGFLIKHKKTWVALVGGYVYSHKFRLRPR